MLNNEHLLHLWKRHICNSAVGRQLADWHEQVRTWCGLCGLLYSHYKIYISQDFVKVLLTPPFHLVPLILQYCSLSETVTSWLSAWGLWLTQLGFCYSPLKRREMLSCIADTLSVSNLRSLLLPFSSDPEQCIWRLCRHSDWKWSCRKEHSLINLLFWII